MRTSRPPAAPAGATIPHIPSPSQDAAPRPPTRAAKPRPPSKYQKKVGRPCGRGLFLRGGGLPRFLPRRAGGCNCPLQDSGDWSLRRPSTTSSVVSVAASSPHAATPRKARQASRCGATRRNELGREVRGQSRGDGATLCPLTSTQRTPAAVTARCERPLTARRTSGRTARARSERAPRGRRLRSEPEAGVRVCCRAAAGSPRGAFTATYSQ